MVEGKIYVLKLELDGSSPKIWREVEVPSNYTFFKLHEIIQEVMLWKNYHLHKFEIQIGKSLVEIVSGEEGKGEKEKQIFLFEYLEESKEVRYIYDFGDYWVHKIKLKEIREEEKGVDVV